MIRVVKRDENGDSVWAYSGELLARGATWVCVRAPFNYADKDLGYVVFRRGDTFIEWHYSDRWYNVFEVYDVEIGNLKGWYCNITRPAVLEADLVYADDLALDVFVTPQGEILLDDEDEFAELNLPPDEQRAAWDAVAAIRRAVAERSMPFDQVTSE